jgi:hypothetical protein
MRRGRPLEHQRAIQRRRIVACSSHDDGLRTAPRHVLFCVSLPADGQCKDARVIPDPVRKLIADIDSVEQLEVLLFVREHRSRTWTVDEINERLRSSATSVRARLDALAQRGLIEQDSRGYRYEASPELDTTVAGLARAYAERRFTVIELIFARPTDKLRAFADAFRVGSATSDKKRKK